MVLKNKAELERELLRSLKKAMNLGSKRVLGEMYDKVGQFYTGAEPKMYVRTGALANTPEVTEVSSDGNEVSFTAYFDDTGRYSTGKRPTMHDVLDLANYGKTDSSVGTLYPAVGKGGFVERADANIEKIMDSTLRQFFR